MEYNGRGSYICNGEVWSPDPINGGYIRQPVMELDVLLRFFIKVFEMEPIEERSFETQVIHEYYTYTRTKLFESLTLSPDAIMHLDDDNFQSKVLKLSQEKLKDVLNATSKKINQKIMLAALEMILESLRALPDDEFDTLERCLENLPQSLWDSNLQAIYNAVCDIREEREEEQDLVEVQDEEDEDEPEEQEEQDEKMEIEEEIVNPFPEFPVFQTSDQYLNALFKQRRHLHKYQDRLSAEELKEQNAMAEKLFKKSAQLRMEEESKGRPRELPPVTNQIPTASERLAYAEEKLRGVIPHPYPITTDSVEEMMKSAFGNIMDTVVLKSEEGREKYFQTVTQMLADKLDWIKRKHLAGLEDQSVAAQEEIDCFLQKFDSLRGLRNHFERLTE